APLLECLVAFARVRPDRNRATDMIEHNRRLREGARQVDQIAKLRLEHPSIEGQAERGERRKPFAERLIQQQALRHAAAERLEDGVVAPSRAVANAPHPAVRHGDMPLEHTLSARACRRSTYPTIPAMNFV